jgi:hypothetical protein
MPARTSPQSSSSFEINNKGISGVDKSKGSGLNGIKIFASHYPAMPCFSFRRGLFKSL